MVSPVTYNKESMTLRIQLGRYYKVLQCPFKTWWKARKYFRRPLFKFYFGPTVKNHGKKMSKWGEYIDYTQVGFWPMASTEYLKWNTPKWFPINIMSWDIGWKDKWYTPRYENPGYFVIYFGRNFYTCWQFSMVVKAPEVYCDNDCTKIDHEDNYWESMLWYLHYADEYNEKDKTKDLFLARNSSYNTGHWTTHISNKIEDFKLVDVGYENLNMGNNDMHTFMWTDITSDDLYDKIVVNEEINVHKLCGINNIGITVDKVFETNQYVRIFDVEGDKHKIRLFFDDNGNKLMSALTSTENNEIKIELSYFQIIDLGPSFKDEFLNKKGVKLIKSLSKK